MRGIGAHTPPALMQPEPPDNTSTFVDAQVVASTSDATGVGLYGYAAFTACGEVIHTESAREIAAWYQSPGRLGRRFERFAGTGEIVRGFLNAIDYELDDAPGVNRAPLLALRAYVEACPTAPIVHAPVVHDCGMQAECFC
jgi:hypothetical protein